MKSPVRTVVKENDEFKQIEKRKLEKVYWEKYQREKEKLIKANREREQTLAENQKVLAMIVREKAELEKGKKAYEQQREADLELARSEAGRKTEQRLSEQFHLKEREWNKRLADQNRLISELKRKSEQGPVQLQGQVQEMAIEERLQRAFPADHIIRTVTGNKGADLLHKIINRNGKECGVILFESKRTRAFSHNWLPKLKEDQRRINADLAILITQAMPTNIKHFGHLEGVWVCSYSRYLDVVGLCREMLIRIYAAKKSFDDVGRKKDLIYSYFTSAQFKEGVEMFIRLLDQQRKDMDKEKRTINGYWQKRSGQLDQLRDLVLETFGKIEGLTSAEENMIEPVVRKSLPSIS